jgi:hypothetical protein
MYIYKYAYYIIYEFLRFNKPPPDGSISKQVPGSGKS